jgi:hypothetical protein
MILSPKTAANHSSREEILTGKVAPHVNLGHVLTESTVPPEVASLPRWLAWCWKLDRDGRWGKLPQVISPAAGGPALKPGFSKNREADLKALLPLKKLLGLIGAADIPLGMMLVPGQLDERTWLVALDFDNLKPDEPNTWPIDVARAFEEGHGWWSRSVSGYGIRVVGTVDLASLKETPQNDEFSSPFKVELMGTKQVTITNANLALPGELDITDFWNAMHAMLPAPKVAKLAPSDWTAGPEDSDPEFMALLVERAKAYTGEMPPAVQGSNGSGAFFRVCCKIAGGYGLRGEEGFALASQWNQSNCHPPFSEGEVIHKWNDALRETEGEFPNKRQWAVDNHRERKSKKDGPKRITARAKPAEEPAVPVLRERVPMSLDTNNDSEVRARIVEIVATDPTGMPLIFDRVNDSGTKAVHVAIKEAKSGLRYPVIVAATNAHVREAVTRCISFTQRTPHGVREVTAKDRHLDMIRENPVGLPKLKRVLHGPIYDPEVDAIMNTAGYCRETGYLLAQAAKLAVPDRVTREMIPAAVQELNNAFRFVQFRTTKAGAEVYLARFLAELMTVLMRHKMVSAPAFIHSANDTGAGKSYLARAASLICHGRDLAARVLPVGLGAEAELKKSLFSIALSSEPLAFFDNLDRATIVRSPALEALMTSSALEDRILNVSETGRGDYDFTVVFTGNQVRPHKDFRRRTVEIHLVGGPKAHRRAQDAFGEQGDLIAYLTDPVHRGRLLSALMTIARGYQQAGRPAQPGENLGGFPGFIDHAVNPIRWATGIDPLAGHGEEYDATNTEGQALSRLIMAMIEQEGGPAKWSRFRIKDMFAAAEPTTDLWAAMVELAKEAGVANCGSRSFGKTVLPGFIENQVDVDGKTWWLEEAGEDKKLKVNLYRLVSGSDPNGGGYCGYGGEQPPPLWSFHPNSPKGVEQYPPYPAYPPNGRHVPADGVPQTSQTSGTQGTPLSQSDALGMSADIPEQTGDTANESVPIDREAIRRRVKEGLAGLRAKAPVFRGATPADDPADLAGTKLDAMRGAIRASEGDRDRARAAFLASGFTKADWDHYLARSGHQPEVVAGRVRLVPSA